MHHLCGESNTGRSLERFFNKIKHGGGCPRSVASRKLHDCGFKCVGLQASKLPKLVFFGIKLPQRGISP